MPTSQWAAAAADKYRCTRWARALDAARHFGAGRKQLLHRHFQRQTRSTELKKTATNKNGRRDSSSSGAAALALVSAFREPPGPRIQPPFPSFTRTIHRSNTRTPDLRPHPHTCSGRRNPSAPESGAIHAAHGACRGACALSVASAGDKKLEDDI